MNIITTFNLFLELGVQYLRLKIKTSTFDILDKFDARIDKLDGQREKLRKSTNSADQERADKMLDEILEEKKKLSLFCEEQKLGKQLDGKTKIV